MTEEAFIFHMCVALAIGATTGALVSALPSILRARPFFEILISAVLGGIVATVAFFVVVVLPAWVLFF